MFRISVAAGAAAVGAALMLAHPVQASPQDDQFINEVKYSAHGMWNQVVIESLIMSGHAGCTFLDQGYSSTEAMNIAAGKLGAVNPIGLMTAATRAYCPEYAYLYAGL